MESEVTGMDLSTILTDFGSFMTAAVTWIGNVFQIIYDNPIALLVWYVWLAGSMIGLVRRILSVQ